MQRHKFPNKNNLYNHPMTKKKIEAQLAILNQQVNEAVAERTKFLDDNMHLFAEFQIGDHLKNVTGGEGVCVGHYRCQAKSFEFDTSFKVDSKIRWIDRFSSEKPEDWKNFNWQDLKGGSIDNTSHYGYENPWFKVGDKKAEQEKLKNFAERRNY